MSLPASDLTKKPDMRTTMELGAVLPETAEVRDDHLFIGGVDMVELARKEGTALYVFDEADLAARRDGWDPSHRRCRFGRAKRLGDRASAPVAIAELPCEFS